MLDTLLRLKRFPWFTALSVLTAVGLVATVVHEAIYLNGHPNIQAGPGMSPSSGGPYNAALGVTLCAALGVGLSLAWGAAAHFRGERWGGRIAVAGIALQSAAAIVFNGAAYPIANHARERESNALALARTWATRDMLVQPDGKLILLGSGLVRLLPDGERDASFHRDYSLARGGSLPASLPGYWPEGACAALAPNGDLILAGNGWLGRIRPDGSDARDLLKRPDGGTCWGLAVQPDGKILIGWDSPKKSPISRLLPDGSADPGFHPAYAPTPGPHRTQWPSPERIVVLRDGRIVLVGPIEQADRICLDVGLTELANGGCVRTLLRLNADGALDKSFHFGEPGPPANVAGQDVPYLIAVFPNASMLVRMNDARHAGSGMTFLDGEGRETRRPGLGEALARPTPPTAAAAMSDGGVLLAGSDWFVRVRPDGTLDPGFRPLHTYVSARKILAQGHKVLILDDSGELVRLNPDGTRDPGFQTPAFKAYSN